MINFTQIINSITFPLSHKTNLIFLLRLTIAKVKNLFFIYYIYLIELTLMDKIYISSSNIISIAYDYHSKTLAINFKCGEKHQYNEVPFCIYQGLMASNSKEAFYYSMIEHKYPYS